MKVSVVTPTYNRERFLPGLYHGFATQTYPDLELVIDDDSPEPSRFLSGLTDDRVQYAHSATRASIGTKRNRLIERSRGDVIVFFDDDDYYAPTYVEQAVSRLRGADVAKLVGWYAWWAPDEQLFYWDTTRNDVIHHKVGQGPMGLALAEQFPSDFCAKNSDGYGFSLAFGRRVLAKARFPDRNFGEDVAFVSDVRRAGGVVVQAQDDQPSVVHVLHAASSSVVFPQYRLPPTSAPVLFPGLARYLALVSDAGG